MIRSTTNAEKVTDYVEAILTGRQVAGKLERAACERYQSDLIGLDELGLRFDQELGGMACDFFPLLLHTTGEYNGQAFELAPFQRFIVWNLFGFRRVDNNLRRFRRAFISMARGNGKSPFAAALLLMLFGFDHPHEPRAACYTVATKRDQARIVFDEIKRFVERQPELRQLVKILRSNMTIPSTGSTLEPLGSDSKTKDGLIPHGIALDELHAWSHYHDELWDKLATAMGKRRQPLLITITTAGNERSTVWRHQYDAAVDVVSPACPTKAEDEFVYIAEIDEGDDPLDEAVWGKANPLLDLGVVKLDYLRRAAAKAKNSAVELSSFTRYHCNRQVTSVDKIIPADLWANGSGQLPDLVGRECHAGFDWGWRDDLAALVLVFPLDYTTVEVQPDEESEGDEPFQEQRRRYAVLARAWCPEAAPRDLLAEPWASWIRDGWLTITPGNSTDTASIYSQLKADSDTYGIKTIALDSNNCREFGSRINTLFGIEPFWFGQTTKKFNEPTHELVNALKENRLLHGDNNLLTWSASNLVVEMDSREYIRPAKKQARDKIDPMVALIMAISECQFAEQAPPNPYADANNDTASLIL